MPSAPANHVSMSEFPSQREGDTGAIVSKMDGVVRKAGNVVAGTPTHGRTSDPADGGHPVAAAGSRPDKHSVGYMLRSGIAGGIAGCAAKTTVAPLDRVKILFQTNNPHFAKYTSSWIGVARAMGDIYAHDGVLGLFRGHSATLLKIYPYAAIKFVAYEQYRAFIIGSKQQETWIRRFASGALAGVTSVFFTYPLEVVRVRLAFETKHRSSSLAGICKKIYHEYPLPKSPLAAVQSGSATSAVQGVVLGSGLVNFYRGFSTTLLGMVPYAGVSFLTHDTVGDILRLPSIQKYTTLPKPANSPVDKPAPLRAWAELTSGGISGAVSQTVSYPLEVIRRRMQVSGAVGDGRRLRIAETASMIFRERGVPGFFVGLTIGYVKVVPLAAVSFYTYERLKTVFGI
ncbi:mitochondrial carrier protein LEU5 [Durotheca rogersii]|uniref:mitochondrial carrier protein LEU5 n=1 Tax=Durotheca rogersii TaxID=419775 RepID=UPI00221E49D5|nr:mitochondrial carrier protein LEU5 [Durotheca rogersii]KAI5868506.1 mitochondrial carrier protein LEU5 [Durotheca rogersii]